MRNLAAVLTVALASTACAVSSDEGTTSDLLCTVDNPDCGPPGSNPSPAQTAANASRGAYSSQADSGSERISCQNLGGGEYSCQVSFTILGNVFGGFCSVFVVEHGDGTITVSAISCTAAHSS